LWVVKIGGSIIDRGGHELLAIVEVLRDVWGVEKVVVICGGGRYADLVRRLDSGRALGPLASHRLAILAMELNSYRLASLDPYLLACVESVQSARLLLEEEERIPVLLPLRLVERSSLPASWNVTSDSIAAYLAKVFDAPLVLLKVVDGIFEAGGRRVIRRLPAPQLRVTAQSPVDDYFHVELSKSHRPAWIINGLRPQRLKDLLLNGDTYGTRVDPGKGEHIETAG